MKKSIFYALVTALFTACSQAPASDAGKNSNDYFETGCYYISEEPGPFSRQLLGTEEFYYLLPGPIIHVSQFTDMQISKRDGYSIYIQFNKAAAKTFGDATEKSVGKRLAFIVDDELVMAPKVNGRIDGESIQITGNYTEEEIVELYRKIKRSMEESSD